MKKMIYNAPLAYFGILMNGQKVKVGYWNLFADGFEKDLADHLLGGFRSRGSCLLRSADGSRLFGAACAVAEGERIWRLNW